MYVFLQILGILEVRCTEVLVPYINNHNESLQKLIKSQNDQEYCKPGCFHISKCSQYSNY